MTAKLLDGYAGPAIPARIQSFLSLLTKHSIEVVVTGPARKTIRLFVGGRNLGYVNGAVIKRGALFGYRFLEPKPGSDSCPEPLVSSIVSSVCQLYQCTPEDVDAYAYESGSNSGRTFLLFREPTSALRALQIEGGHQLDPDVVITEVDARFVEGRTVEIVVHKRERDPAARQKCLSIYGFSCFVCGQNLKVKYQGLETEVIHVHHEEPLYLASGEREFDPVVTLKPLCPNCHCVAHAKSPPYTIAELQNMLRGKA